MIPLEEGSLWLVLLDTDGGAGAARGCSNRCMVGSVCPNLFQTSSSSSPGRVASFLVASCTESKSHNAYELG